MSKTPNKFKMGSKPKPISEEKSNGFSINAWALAFFVVMVALVATLTVKSVQAYGGWKANWDVISFAKENPELVRDVKYRYDTGIAELKQELVSPKE